VWNENGQTLVIHITPPWWKTTLAYILYVIFTIAGIIAFIKIRERKLVEEKRVLEAKVKARTHEIMMQKEEILKQRDKIADQNKNITDSIHYASRIQAALLPSEEYLKNVLPSYFILWRPRDIVSGDFFWITHENSMTIAVAADCTGHGVPGAFMSMLGIAFLNDLVNKDKIFETDHILNELRSNIMRALKQTGQEGGSKDGMDISMCAIDHQNLTAKFSGAYNPLVIVRNAEFIEFKGDKMPIGYHIKKDELFSRHDIDLQVGDRLYMYSDGYVDQFGGQDGRKFMSKNFKSLLVETRNLSMPEQKIHLNQTIEKWMGKREQIDDILVFGIEINNQYQSDGNVNKI
jgi:serine phosphatase RsbU (regulator of sigma subunit)